MSSNAPTVLEVQRIAEVADPAVRNLRITQCYQELSLAVRDLIPDGANWCTFATSASKQAGQTIRHQDLLNVVRQRIEESGRVAPLIRNLVSVIAFDHGELFGLLNQVVGELGPLQRTANEVAAGNLRVFAEIGWLFVRFLELFPDAANARDEAKFEQFRGGLKPGEPPDGQELLGQAFHAYREAILLPAGKARAERLLLANLLVGYHEQIRLQPQIKGALDGALVTAEDVERLLLGRLRAKRGLVARLFDRLLPSRLEPLRALTKPLANEVKEVVRMVITDHLMTLALPPDRVLRLGRDIPGHFPADLATIASPDLVALLRKVDPTGDTTAASGACDWANFKDRIHFIADLFRVFHEDPALFDPPYTDLQVAELKADLLPHGKL